MKKIFMSMIVVAFISGCSTTPSSPKPHKTKYTFQCLNLTLPDAVFQKLTFKTAPNFHQNVITLSQPQIEEVLKNPTVKISEFPVVYAALGETVTNDQTKAVSMAVDAKVVDGKIVYTEEPQKIGKAVVISLNKLEGDLLTYQLKLSDKQFVGFDKYKVSDELVAKMPYFEGQSVDTEITQKANTWLTMWGITHESSTGEKTQELICIRVIPPEPF